MAKVENTSFQARGRRTAFKQADYASANACSGTPDQSHLMGGRAPLGRSRQTSTAPAAATPGSSFSFKYSFSSTDFFVAAVGGEKIQCFSSNLPPRDWPRAWPVRRGRLGGPRWALGTLAQLAAPRLGWRHRRRREIRLRPSFKTLNEGKNADYIPALAKVPSEPTSASNPGDPARQGLHRRRHRTPVLHPVDFEGLHHGAGLPAVGGTDRRGRGRRRRHGPGLQLHRRRSSSSRQGDEPAGEPGGDRHHRARSRAQTPTRSGPGSSASTLISPAVSFR